MTKNRFVYRTILLAALVICLTSSPAWAAPNEGSLVGWGDGLTTVPANNDFVAIAAGASHSLALKSDGSLASWGFNSDGQTNVPPGNDFVAIAAGWYHNLALKSDGSLTGWGLNDDGQTDVPTGSDFAAIAAGFVHGLAIKFDGSLVGWGYNGFRQTDVPAGNDFVAVAAGWHHSLALKSDGSLAAWGNNILGQTNVPAGNDFVAIAAGGDHSLAIQVPEPASLALALFGLAALSIHRSRRIVSYLCLCCALSVTTAAPAARYTITDLGSLGGSYSAGFGMNASGQVTGLSNTNTSAERAFYYDGAMHDLGTLGGTLSVGQGLNDLGQVAGFSRIDGDSEYHAFFYDGAMHDLGTLGETSSIGSDINNSGQVTGYSVISGGLYYETRAFIWTTGGGMQDLGLLGGSSSAGYGINDSGHVTGGSETIEGEYHAILYDGTMHDLGTLGGTYSIGFDVSEDGLVTGSSRTTESVDQHAFLWTPITPNGAGGSMIDLGTLGGSISSGAGVNSSGQVVGTSSLVHWYDYDLHAFLYTNGSGIVDLNSLIDPNSGWELFSATAINDAGQITGIGRLFGGADRAYLLTPIVPEPASLALLGFAVPLIVWRNLRRSGAGGVRGYRRCMLGGATHTVRCARSDQ